MAPTSTASSPRNFGHLRPVFAALSLFLTVLSSYGVADEATETHPGISLEPMYSEAVIAYNSKAPAEALKILDSVLRVKADYLQALELRALVLKQLGKSKESKTNYEKLIAVSTPAKAAPYHFELGIIEFNAGQVKAATPHFETAVSQNFNAAAANFFLGLIHFNLGQKSGNLSTAEKHFIATSKGDSAELKPPSHYYLGLIRFKSGAGSEGTHELMEAKSLAKDLPGNAIATDIIKAVDKALAPYGKSQWYGNVTFMEGYNWNIGSLPNSATLPEITSGQKTLQSSVIASIGRMSSPMDTVQWVGAYRGTFNLNHNISASAYQFLTHTADLYLTVRPLARTTYGFKFEGVSSFSDQGTDNTAIAKFQLKNYSLTGEFGPYLRTQLMRGMQLSLETNYRPQKYYTQPELTGHAVTLRSTLSYDRSSTYLNPGVSLSLDKNRALGAGFRYWGATVGLTNLMRLFDRNTFTGSASINFNQYTEGDLPRYDKTCSLRLSWLNQLTSKWTLMADASYLVNFSNLPALYQYSQPSLSGGVGFAF